MLLPDEFTEAYRENKRTPKFVMKDVTESVRNSKDLKKLLQL